MDLISIIIPYYKKKDYITKTIDSVISQSYRNIEIIIIYDNGSVNELDYIQELKSKDPRIKLIINIKNIGAGQSRNKGIKLSKGKYIAFIDSDDLWKKNKLKRQLEVMKKNNYNITHTSYDVIDKNNKIFDQRIARTFKNKESLLKSCDIGLSTVMIKKSILKKNDNFAKIKTKEDFVLWIKLLNKKKYIYGINDKLTKWRKLDKSLSSSVFQKFIDGFTVYNKYLRMNFVKSIYYLLLLSVNSIIKKII